MTKFTDEEQLSINESIIYENYTIPFEHDKISHENVTTIKSFFSSEFLSMSTVFTCVLVSDTARGILFPTLWLNVKRFGGTRIAQGLVIGAFSFGRIVSSPVLGWWCEYHGYRNILIFCNILVLFGCLLYSRSGSLSWLILSQFVIGLGAGSLGVSRSYVAEHSLRINRTINLAYLTSLQYMGFTVMPLLGAILASIGHKHHFSMLFGLIIIDEFSLPALFMALLSIACSLFLLTIFREHSSSNNIISYAKILRYFGCHIDILTLADKILVGGCLLNIATKGTIGVYETLGSEFVTNHFNWSSVKIGYTFSACGVLGVIFLLSFEYLGKHISDIDLTISGMCLMFISCILMSISNLSSYPEIQFYISLILMYSIGYPVGHTAVLGMYSKVIKTGPQGTVQGWFGSAGSFARILFPFIAGILSEYTNDNTIFGVMGCVLLISIVIVVNTKRFIVEIVE